MKKYYARFKETDKEIAIFKSEEERNKWINFKDEFSLNFGVDAENATFQRMALTEAEAQKIAGDFLNMPKLFVKDDFLDGVRWLIV